MSSMFTWFDSGRYAADTIRQQEVFGPPPIAEEAIARFVESLESARTSAPSR